MLINEHLNHLIIDENQNQQCFQKSVDNIDAPRLSRALELMHKHIGITVVIVLRPRTC